MASVPMRTYHVSFGNLEFSSFPANLRLNDD